MVQVLLTSKEENMVRFGEMQLPIKKTKLDTWSFLKWKVEDIGSIQITVKEVFTAWRYLKLNTKHKELLTLGLISKKFKAKQQKFTQSKIQIIMVHVNVTK